jgi:hypothetical protein
MSSLVFKKQQSGFLKPVLTSKTKENKIKAIIEETILDKLFYTLNINKKIYIRLIEYFSTYTICHDSGDKIIASFNLRIKSNIDKRFKKIPGKEIELSGIALKEFEDFLELNGGKILSNYEDLIHKI